MHRSFRASGRVGDGHRDGRLAKDFANGQGEASVQHESLPEQKVCHFYHRSVSREVLGVLHDLLGVLHDLLGGTSRSTRGYFTIYSGVLYEVLGGTLCFRLIRIEAVALPT